MRVSIFRTEQWKWWRESLAKELFDVASLLKYLKGVVSAADFKEKVCALLRTDPEEAERMLTALEKGEIFRLDHNFAPDKAKGQRWTKARVLRTFGWINRFRGDLWRLVAEILDVAHLIGATADDLQTAGHDSARFDWMKTRDWQIILESGATSFGRWGDYWDEELFKKHVHGQSTG